jgi:hypothetical protein
MLLSSILSCSGTFTQINNRAVSKLVLKRRAPEVVAAETFADRTRLLEQVDRLQEDAGKAVSEDAACHRIFRTIFMFSCGKVRARIRDLFPLSALEVSAAAAAGPLAFSAPVSVSLRAVEGATVQSDSATLPASAFVLNAPSIPTSIDMGLPVAGDLSVPKLQLTALQPGSWLQLSRGPSSKLLPTHVDDFAGASVSLHPAGRRQVWLHLKRDSKVRTVTDQDDPGERVDADRLMRTSAPLSPEPPKAIATAIATTSAITTSGPSRGELDDQSLSQVPSVKAAESTFLRDGMKRNVSDACKVREDGSVGDNKAASSTALDAPGEISVLNRVESLIEEWSATFCDDERRKRKRMTEAASESDVASEGSSTHGHNAAQSPIIVCFAGEQ